MTPFQIRNVSAGATIQNVLDGLNNLVSSGAAFRTNGRVPEGADDPATGFCLDIYRLAAEAGVEPFIRTEHPGPSEIPGMQ